MINRPTDRLPGARAPAAASRQMLEDRAGVLTVLSRVGVAELLNTAPDLLRGADLAGLFEDVLCDELVAIRESCESPGRLGLGGGILLEPWEWHCQRRARAFPKGTTDLP